ncbi:uncharacterized protein LOC112558806 [Pomacea canaliculata]|uniref:uncharacterized protein LOC112558806 n=1 Tax=Pomacea canaliculata TaxID=400727 RepID=UPI000D73DD6D|nr:uncharacterized protein LOC112558806 [Pomacea canaliculata]
MFMSKELDNGTECPACDSAQILSFDANFGLVRKKSRRTISVDNFLATQKCSTKKGEGECSNFQAGSNIRSKSRTLKLDETAVFGCACRHEFPRLFFNLKHDERQAHSAQVEEGGDHRVKDSKQQLDKLIKEQKEPVNLATVEQWQSEEKTACQVADGSMTARDKYLLALYDLYSKQSSVVELNQEEESTNLKF